MTRRVAPPTLAVLVALAAPAAAGAQESPRIAAGVAAGGVDLSGLTVGEAAAKLGGELGGRLGAPVVVRTAGRRFTLAPSAARFRFDAGATARRALAARRPAETPSGGGAAFGADVPLAVRHSKLAVRAFARRVAAAVHRAPRNARVRLGLKRIRLRRARTGVGVNVARLAAQLDRVLDRPLGSRFVAHDARTLYPPVNADDLRAQYGTVITIDKANFKLRLFKRLKLVRTYRIAVGQPGYPTPSGRFRIQDKQVNPAWSVPNSPWAGELAGSRVPGGSPANPLKARWMGIVNGVGIHGTGQEWSIGSRASHGCIRMRVADVIALYRRVPVGTPVIIR